MDILLQTTIGLKPEINVYGCFFLDCLAIGQIKSGHRLTTDKINDAWAYCCNKEWLDKDDDGYYQVAKPDLIIGYGLYLCGITGSANNVKVISSNGSNWIPAWYQTFDFMFKTNVSDAGVHYRLYDNLESLIYDSYPNLMLGPWEQKSYYQLYISTI